MTSTDIFTTFAAASALQSRSAAHAARAESSTFIIDIGERPSQRRKTALALLLFATVVFCCCRSGTLPLSPPCLVLPPTSAHSSQMAENFGLVFQGSQR